MDPLLKKPTTVKHHKRSRTCGLVTVFSVIAFVICISIASYFDFGASFLNDNNAAKVLARTPQADTSTVTDSASTVAESSSTITDSAKMTQDDDTTTSTSYYNADGADDVITVMPGLDEDSCSLSATSCGFNQYSGYLMATNEHEIHYWFIEVDSEDDPLTKPVFFWTNGGPGCSGMDGLLTEMGPWRVNDDLSISYNPYSWTTEVNMVFE